ncbi:MAG: ABC transporter ATP-binding protein/permease [Erysipelotrichales bacterium]|nr:ABC transporter ATP-binding protein/permease [Erysipelotrichales bacterium]
MLDLKGISKIYKTAGLTQKALDKVSVSFRENEFTSILGPSGSGKTTLLNIIGGLDEYTSGDLIVNDVSTKKFKDRDWDSYRNHRVGFIFQSYNLITHQTILRNVELALTLSGISKNERRKRALNALKEVGLEKHVHKKPNQLSGGQMQRVAIARALVNDPEIILADEPTGALDSDTSVQIMNLLKKISEDKLVIMVTHNPELAEEYSSRIIKIKDGKIISDSHPYNGKSKKKVSKENIDAKTKKTKMSYITALSLSFNNLMTKKARTLLVSIAGSIGIIGIALILAVSTGFQNYVDSIQEDTLTSYPLSIQQESTDITSVLLSMTAGDNEGASGNEVKEQQYITSMLSSVSTNDLKSFKEYFEKNYKNKDKDLSNVEYAYSVDPNIYTIDATKKLARVNPSSLFSSMWGSNNIMSSYSSMASIFTQMVDNREEIKKDYDVLAGRWPEKYDEMMIVLSEPNSISDLLVYSLGLRDTDELSKMITSVMSGETVDITNEPLTLSYDDLLNVDLRLVMPADTYKYNSKYDVYEDMTNDEKFMNKLYDKATRLKIVGVVAAKEGISASPLSPGVAYTSELIDYIIDYSEETDVVKKQLKNSEINVFSGNRFDSNKNSFDFEFTDLVKVDNKKLQSAFNINIDQETLEKETQKYMAEINDAITTDITPAKKMFSDNLNIFAKDLLDRINEKNSSTDIDILISNYLSSDDAKKALSKMESEYVIPVEALKTAYAGLLKVPLSGYLAAYNPDFSENILKPIKENIISQFTESALVTGTVETMAKTMMEAKIKKIVLTKVGELTSNLTSSFAAAFNVDEKKIASAFTLNFSEDELARVVNAMMNPSETTQKTNLITLGYQDREEPTYILFYFNSFDGKENFISFIDNYNEKVDEEKEIKYTDATGILMSSVKTIVNAVSYVLIAFVSISLVVSSIMIGVITYISVYERTKEIGILRAIGASKGNISSIFNAETFIIGLLSGVLGIAISYSFIPIINGILHKFTGNIPLSATLAINHAIILIVLAIILTLIGGLIPSRMASKKDPVEALRTE